MKSLGLTVHHMTPYDAYKKLQGSYYAVILDMYGRRFSTNQ